MVPEVASPANPSPECDSRARRRPYRKGTMGGIESADAPDPNAAALFADVAPLFRGRSLAIELGVGSGDVLLEYAATFDRVRGVDADPRMLALLQERATRAGIANAEGVLIDRPWDEPTGAADYVYALNLFRQVEDRVEAANYLQRISMALRRGGIAHVRFDSRPRNVARRLQQRLPERLRPPSERIGVRSVRRLESWVRDRMRGADLEIIGERGAGTIDHWVVARRR
jgi:cyclopropane fatty-acyl-phospholipid synthase-like methyltransferase